jgi:hypothetical protein
MTPPSPTLPNSLWANSQRHARRIYTHNTFYASGQIGVPSRANRRSPACRLPNPRPAPAALGSPSPGACRGRSSPCSAAPWWTVSTGGASWPPWMRFGRRPWGCSASPCPSNSLAFLVGMAESLFDTASGSVLPAVVAKESLREANGRVPAGQIFANNMAGPLLGGMLCASVAALPPPTGRHLRRNRADLGAARSFPRPARSEGGEYPLPLPSKPRSPRALVALAAPPAARPRAHRRGDEPHLRRAFAVWVPYVQEGLSARCATVRWPQPSPLGRSRRPRRRACGGSAGYRRRPPRRPAGRGRHAYRPPGGRFADRHLVRLHRRRCGARDAAPLASPHARGKGAGSGWFPRAGSG